MGTKLINAGRLLQLMIINRLLIFLCIIFLYGCEPTDQKIEIDDVTPEFTIKGHIAGDVGPDKPVMIYKVENESLENILEKLRWQKPLGYTMTQEYGKFQFHNLTEGTYCLLLLAFSYQGTGTQNFPYIQEYNISNYSITQAWAGGNRAHSLGILIIQPITK